MANETQVTFQGWIGTEVTERLVGDATVASFRVGSTPRRWSKEHNGFIDNETNWYTVNAWRGLGRNCLSSLKKGDPVTVHGKLRSQLYVEGERKTQSYIVEAFSVGHDLSWGTTLFSRTTSSRGPAADDTELRALNAELGAEEPQISSDGRSIDDLVSRDRGGDAASPVSSDEPAA